MKQFNSIIHSDFFHIPLSPEKISEAEFKLESPQDQEEEKTTDCEWEARAKKIEEVARKNIPQNIYNPFLAIKESSNFIEQIERELKIEIPPLTEEDRYYIKNTPEGTSKTGQNTPVKISRVRKPSAPPLQLNLSSMRKVHSLRMRKLSAKTPGLQCPFSPQEKGTNIRGDT